MRPPLIYLPYEEGKHLPLLAPLEAGIFHRFTVGGRVAVRSQILCFGFKYRHSKKGAGIKNLDTSVDEFILWINEAKALQALFFRLHGCFVFDHPVSSNFILDEEGNVSVPLKKA